MKHIKKKYLFKQRFDNKDNNSLVKISDKIFNQKALKANYKSNKIHIQTTQDELYLGFIYNNSGTYVPIALPDFTLVYFDFAYNLNINREKIKKDLLSKLTTIESMNEDRSKELYNFFGISTSCVITLFTSIEAFINHMLPADKEYVVKKNNRTEIYNREQIQLYISFMDKLKLVLPQLYEKNFFTKATKANSLIQNLKDLRDNLVHTKSDETFEVHIEIFKKLLNFNYNDTFEAIVSLFNFYKPNYIEPCPCNMDF